MTKNQGPASDSDRLLIHVHDVKTELVRKGTGRPILFLHPEVGLYSAMPALDRLAATGQLLAPSHPGFGGSALPRHFNSVDDLSYFYLDLFEQLDLSDVTLVGVSLGAWIAAEIATKSCERLSALVLASPVGIKVGARDERDIVDMFTSTRAEYEELTYSNPARFAPDMAKLSDREVGEYVRNWESTALFGWLPYMTNPKLRHRLHRINVPTLFIRGRDDRVLAPSYVDSYAALTTGSTTAVIDDAGHFPHIEQPDLFAHTVIAFMASVGVPAGAAASPMLIP